MAYFQQHHIYNLQATFFVPLSFPLQNNKMYHNVLNTFYHIDDLYLICLVLCNYLESNSTSRIWCRRGRDRIVVGFTTIYAISAYHY